MILYKIGMEKSSGREKQFGLPNRPFNKQSYISLLGDTFLYKIGMEKSSGSEQQFGLPNLLFNKQSYISLLGYTFLYKTGMEKSSGREKQFGWRIGHSINNLIFLSLEILFFIKLGCKRVRGEKNNSVCESAIQ